MIFCHFTKIPATSNSGLIDKNAELTAEERKSILTLRVADLTVRVIAKPLSGPSLYAAKYCLHNLTTTSQVHRGSKPKISERDRCHIIQLVSAGDLSASKVKAEVKLTCCVRTIQRVLKSVDWYWLSFKKRPAQPALTKKHKEVRVVWTSEKALWNEIDWHRVVFSNEKKWNLDGPDGMLYQWIDTRNLIQPNVRRHSGGGSRQS
uniref:Transposable element Tc3 transposase putative n=1 Tax=Albugo laibachii Nc14 TaxID=890382 RepID=F0WZ78_9STRA|nr:Transposable element Tc3 transposase putative [Albugo laibachii Nc14]|eukprot:CCA26794.1 Transposable element Tc3 transposase putative [Albugo laibachii Nc14]